MEVVVKDGIVVGDAVMLSCGVSAELMKVSDVDCCQIRLDGEVRRIEGEWCEVLVRMEGKRGFLIQPMIMALTTRLRNVELTERVHVWNQLNAKSIDRVRRTGSNECEFWAPLGESVLGATKQ